MPINDLSVITAKILEFRTFLGHYIFERVEGLILKNKSKNITS